MKPAPTLAISIATANRETPDNTPVYPIDVTHLAARVVDPAGDGALHSASQGVKVVLPTESALDLTMDGMSIQLAAGMGVVVAGQSRISVRRQGTATTLTEPLPSLHIIECNAMIGGNTPIREMLDLPVMMDAEPADLLTRIFEQLTFSETLIQNLPGGTDISRHVAAMNLVVTLLKAADDDPAVRRTKARDPRIAQLREFLLENMSRTIDSPEMAQHLGMSRTAFFRWAKKALGAPPLKYLRIMRLERSQEWISQNAGTLDEIAYQTGFSSRSHLGREFKKYFGATPAQYRQTANSSRKAEFLARAAERYYSQGRFQEALATCEQGLRSNLPADVLDLLHYQKGLCLRALGRGEEAIREWRALRASGLSHRAGMQECKHVFEKGFYNRSLELIRLLYTNATDRQKKELVFLWMDQVRDLVEAKRPRPQRKYLAVRRELFVHDRPSMELAVNVLRMLGDNLEILEQCKELKVACYNALRRAGRYDEAVARYRAILSTEAIAGGAFLQGRYEKVLALAPRNPYLNVEALIGLGRAEEAIDRYPENSAPAYLALGKYEELLERFPASSDNDEARAAALLALGRSEEVKELLTNADGSLRRSNTWLHLDPDAILKSGHPDAFEYLNDARVIIVLDALLANDTLRAEATLEQMPGIRHPDFWWYDHRSTELLIVSLLRGMLGRTDHLRDDLAEMVANHKYKDRQALWHDAAYLKSRITTAQYRAQPQQRRIEERLTFMRAVANDLKGRSSAARKGYDALVSTRMPFAPPELMRHRFASWRLQQL